MPESPQTWRLVVGFTCAAGVNHRSPRLFDRLGGSECVNSPATIIPWASNIKAVLMGFVNIILGKVVRPGNNAELHSAGIVRPRFRRQWGR